MPIINIASNQISQLTPEQVPAITDLTFNQIVDQINAAPQLYSANPEGRQPLGIRTGDLTVGFNSSGQPSIGINNGAVTQPISSSQTQQDMGFAGVQTGTGAPTTSHFGTNQWGIYTDTGGGTSYLAFNLNGTIKTSTLTP